MSRTAAISKQQIQKLVSENQAHELNRLLQNGTDGEKIHLLRHIGKLPNEFDGTFLTTYLQCDNPTIQYWVIKNVGKLGDSQYIAELIDTIHASSHSLVRREAASALGRMRSRDAVPHLLGLLNDYDPDVILQAVRGLMAFKKDKHIYDKLLAVQEHPNEVLHDFIAAELGDWQPNELDVKNQVVSPDFLKNSLIHGDVRQIMPHFPDESIHLTFTSPPYYNARDYSIYPSYQAYLDFLESVFAEVQRVTKVGRFLIVNTSPVIVPRVGRQHASRRYPIPFDLHTILVQQGWRFVDDIVWVKPEASVKNRNAGFLQHRKPLAYKPNAVTEYLMVYRKHTHRLLDWNMRAYAAETVEQSKVTGNYESSNAWKIDPTFDKIHSAVFPAELCKRVIQFYSYINDLVFDPFAGSGTTGVTAAQLNRHYVLTEQNDTYVERIAGKLSNGSIFSQKSLTKYTVTEVARKRGEYDANK